MKKIKPAVWLGIACLGLVLVAFNQNWFQITQTHHEDHETEELVKLGEKQLKEFDIELSQAQIGEISSGLTLTGEVKINEDNLAHIITYSSGITRQVLKSVGDSVYQGEVLAVLDSLEISSLQEEYLEAKNKLEIANANFKRESELKEERLTTEADFLLAKDNLISAEHDLHAAERKLKIYGYSEKEISNFSHEDHSTSYRIIAPFNGTIIEKDISQGEALEANAKVFVIADLSTVWLDFSLYQKDLPAIREGQEILIEVPNKDHKIQGQISFVSPLLGESTRTSFARVIIPNSDYKLKPGTFVTGQVKQEGLGDKKLLIYKTAVQEIGDQKIVFVKTDSGFKPSPVKLGQESGEYIEILFGLEPIQSYVSKNSFILKAEFEKGEIEEAH